MNSYAMVQFENANFHKTIIAPRLIVHDSRHLTYMLQIDYSNRSDLYRYRQTDASDKNCDFFLWQVRVCVCGARSRAKQKSHSKRVHILFISSQLIKRRRRRINKKVCELFYFQILLLYYYIIAVVVARKKKRKTNSIFIFG